MERKQLQYHTHGVNSCQGNCKLRWAAAWDRVPEAYVTCAQNCRDCHVVFTMLVMIQPTKQEVKCECQGTPAAEDLTMVQTAGHLECTICTC